ncbi:CMGC/DYRK/PRP4 protein kinase [Polytolypa hystricis UAMH7299]|uniref:non-specific serine/threonine protein kinase n=1 Tax=Polytolypa hystricis (strain UAMH7299) TaxID=1447883 RepID=A0A2B7YRZ3_POLH7|nr:CMGC/DYRK/PRP4 protein kinase [Polytolypa hystricis UAMH7299]
MASRRSRSPSSPSEGEIIESGSDTKATTSQTSLNDMKIDRSTRTNISAARSPSSASARYSRRARSRSRSPYRGYRGEKRNRDDDYDIDRNGRSMALRRSDQKFDSRFRGRNDSRRGHGRYYDHDHDRYAGYDRNLRYHDDYDHRSEKRPRTRSRSPFRDNRKARRYTSDERDMEVDTAYHRHSPNTKGSGGGRRSSTEQLVSERGNTLVGAQNSRKDAEFRGNQVQQVSFGTDTDVSETPAASGDTPVDEATLIEQRRKRREAIKAKYRGQAAPLLVQSLHVANETGSTATQPGTPISGNGAETRHSTPVDTPEDTSGAQLPADFKVAKDEDLANTHLDNRNGVDKEEPSAADYDPMEDMKEEKMRHDKRHFGDEVSSGAYDETKATKQEILIPEPTESQPAHMKAKDAFDMFAEDEDEDDMFAEDFNPVAKPTELTANAGNQAVAQELDVGMMDNWDDPEGYYIVMLGELINGRYHVQQNLGRGMFSSVVRATDSKTGNLVAVKIIRNNDTMRKAGMKEIEILQQLAAADPDDKKHIIRFDRQFDHKGHLCMVFENLSMNLREVLKKFGRDVGINLRAIRAYAHQIFLGLSLLRKCNILHADLKPDNLLVNENRNVLKVCDLGSASPASESEITPYLVSRFYRAPEIILGIPYDYAIDIWSIGCTLFELYSGKILFTGRTNNQMLRSIMECRGKLPPKFLRRGSLTHLHFDDMLNFCSVEEDKITGRIVTKTLDFKKPTRDLKSRLMNKGPKLSDAEAKELSLFIDLLDRCLNINPERRCTPAEALKHPFISRSRA